MVWAFWNAVLWAAVAAAGLSAVYMAGNDAGVFPGSASSHGYIACAGAGLLVCIFCACVALAMGSTAGPKNK